MDSKEKFKVIGLMSGTSLDGVDIVYCRINRRNDQWVYTLEVTQTVRYSKSWKEKLSSAHTLTGNELMKLHVHYGRYLGVLVRAFMMKHKITAVDFVSSHGHTIFHQPGHHLTFQLGSGNALHAACGLPVVCDFRSLDVALGGQGAPLVPIGDKLLFHEYPVCLNLGGIANVSMDARGKRVAFDICFANMGLNYLASKAGHEFDKNGALASGGNINTKMLTVLDKVYTRFRSKRPSLGYELFVKHIKSILDQDKISLEDRLATFTESIAREIVSAIPKAKKTEVLCTGGGAFNSFLMYRIIEQCDDSISMIIPNDDVVKYKEALVFALLGVLRVRGEVNSLKSVTGASIDTSGGVMIGF